MVTWDHVCVHLSLRCVLSWTAVCVYFYLCSASALLFLEQADSWHPRLVMGDTCRFTFYDGPGISLRRGASYEKPSWEWCDQTGMTWDPLSFCRIRTETSKYICIIHYPLLLSFFCHRLKRTLLIVAFLQLVWLQWFLYCNPSFKEFILILSVFSVVLSYNSANVEQWGINAKNRMNMMLYLTLKFLHAIRSSVTFKVSELKIIRARATLFCCNYLYRIY